jgi:hypothetical protein
MEQEKRKNSLIYNLKKCSKEMHNNSEKGLQMVLEDLKSRILGIESI